ncbi:MAG: penicillin-binding transpeptidase domain-containing protein, partial [Acidimicrobiales bacterium]
VVEQGTGRRAALDRPVAGKTGTAQAYRAAWFVGYTPDYATAVWMGHADRLASLRGINGVGNVTGGSHPAVAWARIMRQAHEGLDQRPFPEPVEIVPIADSAAEVLGFRLQEFTEAPDQQQPQPLEGNCDGQPCERRAVPLPTVPPPTVPATAAPDTAGSPTAPQTTAPPASTADTLNGATSTTQSTLTSSP